MQTILVIVIRWFICFAGGDFCCKIHVAVQLHCVVCDLHLSVPRIPSASVCVGGQCSVSHCSAVSLWVIQF